MSYNSPPVSIAFYYFLIHKMPGNLCVTLTCDELLLSMREYYEGTASNQNAQHKMDVNAFEPTTVLILLTESLLSNHYYHNISQSGSINIPQMHKGWLMVCFSPVPSYTDLIFENSLWITGWKCFLPGKINDPIQMLNSTSILITLHKLNKLIEHCPNPSHSFPNQSKFHLFLVLALVCPQGINCYIC